MTDINRNPIIERLEDHSDMLATLTEIIAALQRRVEHLEAQQRSSNE
jgi:hypothetical protein